MTGEPVQALVIGAGPAGLMAAEALSAAGVRVVVAEAMPTPARKFLMAGKSGLNLTRDEPAAVFASHLDGSAAPDLRAMLHDFGPVQVSDWARGLGETLFTGTTGRVFPVGMKASPLLRAWLGRLRDRGVDLRTRWRWTGWNGAAFSFATPDGTIQVTPQVTVLALGGASWPRLGSDAAWVPWLRDAGIDVETFRPANMGFRVDWSPAMARVFGAAVKGTALRVGPLHSRGEWVVTAAGIEGGGIYEIASALRDGADGTVDLAPDLTLAALTARLAAPRGKLSVGNWLRRDPERSGARRATAGMGPTAADRAGGAGRADQGATAAPCRADGAGAGDFVGRRNRRSSADARPGIARPAGRLRRGRDAGLGSPDRGLSSDHLPRQRSPCRTSGGRAAAGN